MKRLVKKKARKMASCCLNRFQNEGELSPCRLIGNVSLNDGDLACRIKRGKKPGGSFSSVSDKVEESHCQTRIG